MFKKVTLLLFPLKKNGFVLIQFLASLAFFIALLSSSMSFVSLLKAREEVNVRNKRINNSWELEETAEHYQMSLFTSSINPKDTKCVLSQEEGTEYADLTCRSEENDIEIKQISVLR